MFKRSRTSRPRLAESAARPIVPQMRRTVFPDAICNRWCLLKISGNAEQKKEMEMATIAKAVPAFAALLIVTDGCSTESGARPGSAGSEAAAPADATILQSSVPADGAILSSAPQALVLTFRQNVSLAEVTVAGADGQVIPMMIASAGATKHYSLPLDGIGRGSWTARWRAVDEAGTLHEGQIRFEVR
jgi:methionine-rich copper-binding protein CopC